MKKRASSLRLEKRAIIARSTAVPTWGDTNATQHTAFQVMWLRYDYLAPHARGGTNAPDNMLITCAHANTAVCI